MAEIKSNAAKNEAAKFNAADVLAYIQQNLKASKSLVNDFAKFKYRSAEGILEALKPVIEEAMRFFNVPIYTVATYELVDFGGRCFVKATEYLHAGGCNISTCAFAEVGPHKGCSSEQATGCALSYARKYAMCALYAIDDAAADPDSMSDDELAEAITQVNACTSRQAVECVYAQHPKIATNRQFIDACASRVAAVANK